MVQCGQLPLCPPFQPSRNLPGPICAVHVEGFDFITQIVS
jgi:hypothetical protein